MRTFRDGTIKADCFAEERLLAFPPACGTMLIMLNRFHNYVVEELAKINENGRFTTPDKNPRTMHLSGEALEKAWRKHDNALFQTGRLVTCGLYINITLNDYLRTIVNLNRTNSTWCLDPRTEVDEKIGTPRGTGNQVSAEFALSYRWHSCIGQMDEKWTEMVYKELFGKEPHEVTFAELMKGLSKYDHDLPKDPQQRPFAGLKRDENGRFDDGKLAKIMMNGIEEISGALAQGTSRNVCERSQS
jgi:linoleate 10R-lipoxygenase